MTGFTVLIVCLQAGPADVERAEAIVESPEDASAPQHGPPPATVARRAKSYSDFYDVVRAHLRKEQGLDRPKSRDKIGNELDFTQW